MAQCSFLYYVSMNSSLEQRRTERGFDGTSLFVNVLKVID